MSNEIIATNLIPPAESSLGFRTCGCSIVGLSTALTIMTFPGIGSTNMFDSASGFSTSTGNSFTTYTVPPNGGGLWAIACNFKVAGTFSLNNQIALQLQVNGSVVTQDVVFAQAAATDLDPWIGDYVRLNAGDVLRIAVSSQGTTPTVTGSSLEVFWSGTRVTL